MSQTNPIPRKSLPCGFSLPALGLGTWGTGGREDAIPDGPEANALAGTIRAAVDAGFTRIDTAEYYAAGFSETLVGRAIAGLPRESLFLTSKVWKTHLRRADVLTACDASLARLGTDHLDLYLIHQVSDEVPLEETLEAMDELVDRGKVRWLGVSNFSRERMLRAVAASRHPIVLNQVHYNLRVRECEASGLLDGCREHGVMLEAWRPLRDLSPCPLTDELCARYGCTFPQLALAFLLCQPGVVTLSAMRTAAHLPENLAATAIRLEPHDLEQLRHDFPGQLTVSPTVPLS